MIEELKNVGDTVERILQYDYRARSDDKYLVRKVWEHYGLFLTDEQAHLLFKRSVPSGDTVTRASRKLKEHNPHLRPPQPVQEAKQEKQIHTRQNISQLRLGI